MTFHQLEIFQAVAECLNITSAARKLHISQPSVSKQLRLLEQECGLKLYVKNGRGIRVTEEGFLFRQAVAPILSQMHDLKLSFVHKAAEAPAKTLIVGSTPSPAAFFLPGVLKSFVELHPAIHPVLRTGYPKAIEEMVLDERVEIAVTTNLPDNPEIIAEPVYSEKIVVVGSAKHPLARKGKLTEAELAQAPFVMTTGGRIAEEIARLGLKLNIVMWCESVELKKASVQAGLGLGLFYRGSAEAGLREGYFKVIEIPQLQSIKITFFVIHRKGIVLSAHRRDLITLLRERSKEIASAA